MDILAVERKVNPMLKRFEVSGFKNFQDTFSLNFADIRDYQFNADCISHRLVNTGIIYGKNSVGKTNFGLALFDIVSHLSAKNVTPHVYDYYLNVSSLNDYAEFHYVFQFDDRLVDYRYRKNEKRNLIYEKLSLDGDLLYEYDYIKNRGATAGISLLAPTLNWAFQDTDCILKYVLNNTILDDTHPLRKMMRFVNSMLWFRGLGEEQSLGVTSHSDDYYNFVMDDTVRHELEHLLHASGIEENLIVKTGVDGTNRLYFDTDTPLPFFSVASSGAKALYTFFYWYKTAKDASLLFIDDFDAFYHFEVSKYIVSLLKKIPNTQVLLTSHNTNLLTNKIMRPDCYFVLTQDKLTSLANATQRELREGHNLEKLYISGEFTN